MSIPTREEFKLLIGAAYSAIVNYESDPSRSCGADIDVAERGLTAAYDAALARIAELEKENTAMAERLIAGSEPIFASNAQLRARIAREFLDAVDAEWFSDGTGSMDEIRDAVLARWEAAGKEGE